jgi:tripartite-type tricarboxylate transporter receptor subunit TctC
VSPLTAATLAIISRIGFGIDPGPLREVMQGELTPAQIAYWDGVFGKIAASPEFKEQADKNQWEISYKNSAETAKFFASEYADLKSVMDFLGLSGKAN